MIKKYSIEELLKYNEKISEEIDYKGAVIVKEIDRGPINILYNEAIDFFNSHLKEKYLLDELRGYFLEDLEDGNIRESIKINSTVFENDEDDEIKQERWPFYQDFPVLEKNLGIIYDKWLEICDSLFRGVGQGILSVFKYHQDDKIKFKLQEHHDDSYFVAFAPLGEPLEIYINNFWYNHQLKDREALLIAPRIKHRVLNKFNKERYSITFLYPIEPI